MMNDLDTLNSNLLNEGLYASSNFSDYNNVNDIYSNAIGECGLPPTCLPKKMVTKQNCKKIFGKKVCINVPTGRFETNQSCVDSNKRYKKCMSDKAKRIAQDIKKKQEAAKKKFQEAGKKIQQKVKSVTKDIKKGFQNLGKKAKEAFNKVLRRGLLLSIENNIHGIGTRLYPAVADDATIRNRKYKKSYVDKTKKLFGEVVSKWKSLGGNESELRNAISKGGKKKGFLKNPYKSYSGNNPEDFYLFVCSQTMPMDYSNAEGDGEQKKKGLQAFFAWIQNLFKKKKADENPYEEGSPESQDFNNEQNADAGNEPNPEDADVLDALTEGEAGKASEEAANESAKESEGETVTKDDKILGMPKPVAIGLGIAILAVGGYFVYTKYIKK